MDIFLKKFFPYICNQTVTDMKDTIKTPVSSTGMLIRKPVEAVFEAFVNPEVTTRFWFTHSSGRLEKGQRVQWTWEMS